MSDNKEMQLLLFCLVVFDKRVNCHIYCFSILNYTSG